MKVMIEGISQRPMEISVFTNRRKLCKFLAYCNVPLFLDAYKFAVNTLKVNNNKQVVP